MLEPSESLTEDELAPAFDDIQQCIADSPASAIDPQLHGHDILAGRIYHLAELKQVDKAIVPRAFEHDIQQLGSDSEECMSFDVQSLKGVPSL